MGAPSDKRLAHCCLRALLSGSCFGRFVEVNGLFLALIERKSNVILPVTIMNERVLIFTLLSANGVFAQSTGSSIPSHPVPRAGVFGSGQWSSVNLALAILAFVSFVILAAFLLLFFFRNVGSDGQGSEAVLFEDENSGMARLNRQQHARALMIGRSLLWIIGAALSAMLCIFLFAFSQDFRGSKVLFDDWTAWMTGLYLVQLLTTVKVMQLGKASNSAALSIQAEQLKKATRVKLRGTQCGHFEDDDGE